MELSQTIPTILCGDAGPAALQLRARDVVPLVILAGGFYGAVMGSSGGWSHVHRLQVVYSALKVPLLLGVSFALTVPGFFMLNTLFGLRADFRSSLRAVVTAQAGLAITLASLAPFVALFYASCSDYQWAILFNGGMFAVATAVGQILLRRFYRRLIAAHPRHRMLLRMWLVAYAFIAIQMAWVLRPFVGGHGEAATFFRPGAWGNAYVVVWEILK